MDSLYVFYGKQRVGRIERLKGQWSFQYDEDWLAAADGFAVSITLPLRNEPFVNEAARSFFANLLPEAGVRDALARSIGVSVQNDFELLKAFGGECAGALFITDKVAPQGSKDDGYTLIDEEVLYQQIKNAVVHPLLMQEGIRLSLAGAQQKIPVFFNQEAFYLPQGSAATTHILKPSMAAFPQSVANEFFCMRLASDLGIPTAETRIVLIKDTPVLLCERYDRLYRDGVVVRFHQEDFCQAMGFSYDQKYEGEGGPGIKDCFALLERYGSEPLADKMNLLRWIIFNWKIGNADAHAKNISILYKDRSIRLAPFYDMLSTAVYPSLTMRMAMKVGGENRPQWVKERHWQELAREVEIKPSLVEEEFRRMTDQIEARAPVLAVQLEVDVSDILLKIGK